MADVKVNLRVGGLSSFRSAIKQSQGAVKQMTAELKLAEARYKATGDAETYLAQRSSALKKQIEEQSKIVSECEKAMQALQENGVSKGSEAWTEWATRLANARTQLVTMQSELSGTQTGIGKTSDKLKDGSGKAKGFEDNLRHIQGMTDFSAVQKGIGGITTAIWGAIQKVGALAKALWDAEADATVWADDLLTRASQYGMTPEMVQRWEYASRFFDVEFSELVKAADKTSKEMQKAGHGVITVWGDAEKGMGNVSLFGPDGKERSSFDITLDVLRELGEAEESLGAAQADLLAQNYFGKSYRELKPFVDALRNGTDIEGLLGEAPVVSDENVQKLGEANDALENLKATAEKTKMDTLAALAPSFSKIADAFTKALTAVDEWVNSPEGQEALTNFGDSIADVVASFTAEDFSNALETAKTAIEDISGGFKWIKDNKDTVIDAIKFIGIALGGLKVTDTVLRALQIVQGAGGLGKLFFGGGGGAGAGAGAAGSGAAGAAGGAAGSGAAGAAGSAAAGGGFKAALKAFGAKAGIVAKEAAWGIGVPAAVVSAALAPAVIAEKENDGKWQAERDAALAEIAELEAGTQTETQKKATAAWKKLEQIQNKGGFHDVANADKAFSAIAEMDLAGILTPEEMQAIQEISEGKSTLDGFERAQMLKNVSERLEQVASGKVAVDEPGKGTPPAGSLLSLVQDPELVEGIEQVADAAETITKDVDQQQLCDALNMMYQSPQGAALEGLSEYPELMDLLTDEQKAALGNLGNMTEDEIKALYDSVYDTLSDYEEYFDYGEEAGMQYSAGLMAAVGSAYAAGSALQAAAMRGMNGGGGLLGRTGGGRPLAGGTTYNSNLYVNNMSMGGGLTGQGLLNLLSDGQRRMNYGYGQR